MNKKNIILIIVFLCLVGILYKKYDTKPHKDATILVVGTSADYPPYEFIDIKTGEVIGFDIDVVHEISLRLDKKLVVKNLPFTSLVFALLSGEIDMIAAGMSSSPRRAKFVTFTDTYLGGDYYVVVSQKNKFVPQALHDLVGKNVVVNSGHTAEAFMAKQEGVHLIRLKDISLALVALQAGTADAFVGANSAVSAALKKKNDFEQFAILPLPEASDNCSFAVERHNQKLVQEVNQVLLDMKQDGTLDQLKNRWNL